MIDEKRLTIELVSSSLGDVISLHLLKQKI